VTDGFKDRSDKKTMKSKILFWLCLMVIAFIIGYFHSQLIYLGIMEKWGFAVRKVPFYAYFLLLILSFYITLIIHEITHFLSFLFFGIRLRALYLTMFVFVKINHRWTFKIKPKLWVLFGGLVVPDLPKIHNQTEYDKMRRIFAKSLITAPIATIIFAIFVILLTSYNILFGSNSVWIGYLFIYSIFNTIWSMVYYLTFGLHTETLYGDFVAYKNMKKDDGFALSQIVQYQMFSSEEDLKTDTYLLSMLEEKIKVTHLNFSLFHQMLVIQYLEGLLGLDLNVSQEIIEKIHAYSKRIPIRDEQSLILAHQIVLFFYQQHEIIKAYEMLDNIERKTKHSKMLAKMMTYYHNKTEHVTHINDHQTFLEDDENIYIGQMWIFDAIMNPFLNERQSHKKLPYQAWECPVSLHLELEEQKND